MNFDQRYAMAPIQEEGESDTTHNDSLTDIHCGAMACMPASTPQGDRLVLSYDFTNSNNPMNYRMYRAQKLCARLLMSVITLKMTIKTGS